ncbi:TonB-dependent receptor [Sorangium cellulosum]|uniref:TonB-dependent receptor n=1 Tax=Sorangium cellulosum TaxID=56 RepID=A0A150TQ82_SORCE|nr:TonB-dependent receptor [Sorangium cellulosum]
MHERRGVWAARLAAAASVLVSTSAFATGSGVLTGTVLDASTKKPAADVVVTVTSPALQGEQVVVTDPSGQFRIPNLPPGAYSLRLDKETYRPYSRGDIELRVDSTIRVNSELLPEALKAEEIVVVGSAPTVDVGSSATGVNVTSDFASRVPLISTGSKGAATRSFEALAEVAPGANADQYGVSISGTTSPENQYVIDGLSVNNPAFGVIGTPLSVEFIKEVKLITGGYMPEYGRATGGYLDAVTRSGSNEFHGAVFLSVTPGILEGAREQAESEASTIRTDTRLSSLRDVGAQIGGPILKDRLWFFAGLSPSAASYRLKRELRFDRTEPLPGTRRVYYATQHSLQYLGKLTLLIDPDNTVSLSVYGSPSSSGGDGNFGINPKDGTVELNNSSSNNVINGSFGALAHEYVASATDAALKWSSAFQNKTYLLDVTLGVHHEDNAVRASDGTRIGSGEGLSDIAQVHWQRTDPGFHSINDFEPSAATRDCDPAGAPSAEHCPVATYYSGGPGALNETVLDRYQGKAVLTTLFAALGHHIVKAGVDLELMRYGSSRGHSGGNIFAETTDGRAYTGFRRLGFLANPDDAEPLVKFETVSKSTTIGGFVQDSWNILDKVTLNAGVRYDAQLLYGGDDKLAIALPNQWSPRVGVIYDFTHAGRSKLYANYARFYESVPLNIIDRAFPGERQVFSLHNAALCDPRDVAQQRDACDRNENLITTSAPYSPNQKWRVIGGDGGIDPDLEPQSTDEIVLGGEVEVYPKLRVGVQYTKRYQNQVIEDISRDEARTYLIGNPGYGVAKDFPKPVRDYDAFTVHAEKTFADAWLAQASYTISTLRGNWAGLFRPETGQLDPNVNADFDLMSLLPNRTGPLPGDRRHQLKVFGAKDFTFQNGVIVSVGGSYRSASGAPTSYLGSHPLYGPDQVYILPRGSGERLPWVHTVDAHVGVGVQLARESVLTITVDSFNIFNFQAATALDQRYTQASVLPIEDGKTGDLGQLKNVDGSAFDPNNKNPNFGKPIAYQAPRSFRIGAKVTF